MCRNDVLLSFLDGTNCVLYLCKTLTPPELLFFFFAGESRSQRSIKRRPGDVQVKDWLNGKQFEVCFFWGLFLARTTPPKINIEPENDGLEDVFPFPGL